MKMRDLNVRVADAMQSVADHYDMAFDNALIVVEQLAREVLRERQDLSEFVMGMGEAFFTSKGDKTIGLEYVPEAEDLLGFLDDWDEYLKITGNPMRFTAGGNVITEW